MNGPSRWFLVFSAVSIIAIAILSAFAISRAVGRRARATARQDVSEMRRRIEDHLAGEVTGVDLKRTIATADPATFWSALEGLSLGLRRAQRRALASAIGRGEPLRLERRALRDESPWRRELAARRLGLLPAPRNRSVLRESLAQGPEAVTLAAARALAEHRDRVALAWLLDHADALASRTPREWAGLIQAFGRGAHPYLAERLALGGMHPRAERAAIEALARGGHDPAIAAIETRLRHADSEVRVAAARALGRLEAGVSGSSLIAALRDEAWPVRAIAAWALGRARVPTAVEPLAARLTDRSWWVRRHAAYALAVLGPDGESALRHVIATTSDPYARDMAAEALETGNRASA